MQKDVLLGFGGNSHRNTFYWRFSKNMINYYRKTTLCEISTQQKIIIIIIIIIYLKYVKIIYNNKKYSKI